LLTALASGQVAGRIWSRDTGVFSSDRGTETTHAAIRARLGWLDAPALAISRAEELHELARNIRLDGISTAILLGMGGSSLCAEVLRDVPAPKANACRLVVLDTTDERTIRRVADGLDPARTIFIVASKSGTTIEVSSLERYFWAEMTAALGADAGRHFLAITDPGTPLESLAAARRYRNAFINPPDIGGRYSALSLFGMVPAALLGMDVGGMARSAERMAVECCGDNVVNPGLALGAFMAEQASNGRDKLTLLMAPELAPLGPWIEQLVAESTGKDGRGVLPIVDEPAGRVEEYGDDRAFVAVTTEPGGPPTPLARELDKAGYPVLFVQASPRDLGAEFFRWEFATAVAGAALSVNPFDEPNVREAKTRTQAQLDARAAHGAFHLDPPLSRGDGYSRREFRPTWQPATPRRRYLAILDYLPGDERRIEMIGRLRAKVRKRTGLATTHGIGPRYLHSTGQFHKGGPNSGIFVLLTAADSSATPIPGAPLTFSMLKQAQALGDFDALVANGREVVHYHLDDPTADFSTVLEKVLGQFN
jgi:glucose-6-phosphate isomerase